MNGTSAPHDIPAVKGRAGGGRYGFGDGDRSRLADELHDGPIQLAVSVVLELETAQTRLTAEAKLGHPEIVAGLVRSKLAVQQAIDELRTIVRSLSTDGLLHEEVTT